MCGRLTIDGLVLADRVSAQFGIPYHPQTNLDLRPTEPVTVIGLVNDQLASINCTWGIKPNWSKYLLINAQAETVREKKTFVNAFAHHRCVVPCSGWYEWRDEGGKRKQKYLFSRADEQPLYMAGILFPSNDGAQLVTLTTAPTVQCSQYHNRMPLLIASSDLNFWYKSDSIQLESLLHHPEQVPITIHS
ncbi:SOS response-associated peptidase [Shewanella xiamenensis]|uniref:Abasic site processing protein n=1 Tax=Shewanella xiamenensis TaxID=332186 RepID=A0AAW6QVA9_9GAMM|nr:SOS response-associated peptidase [Shewanella xiamenensis]MDG5899450.1 SOS response-associated peptidase [Shewanella xiamenensis]